jgi:tetratricopeptide (TPR) repeat protein
MANATPDSADDLVEEGFRLSQRKQWEAAVRCYVSAIERAPDHKKAHRNLAFALNRVKRYEEARETAGRGLKLEGLLRDHRASLLYECAFAEQNTRQYDAAFDNIQEALSLNPTSVKYLYFRARLQEYRGLFTEAKQDAREVLGRVPDHSGALRLLDQYAD